LGRLQCGSILTLTLRELHDKHAVQRGIYTDAQTFIEIMVKTYLSLYKMQAPSALKEQSVTAI
jgi:hypothetical protein